MRSLLKKPNIFYINITIMVSSVIILFNLSQLPYFVENEKTYVLILPGIMVLLFLSLLRGTLKAKTINFSIFILLFIFILGVLLMELFTENSYLNTRIFYSFTTIIFLYLLFLIVLRNNNTDIETLLHAYINSTIILTIIIYYKYFFQQDSLFSSIYVYGSKNSVSLLILTAILLLFFTKSKIYIFLIIKIIWLFFILLILRSRSTLVSIPFIIGILLIDSKLKKQTKWGIILLIIIICVIIIVSPNLYEIVINGIILAGRTDGSIDDISSGRITDLLLFFENIESAYLVGLGKFKIESLLPSLFIQYGIFIGSIPILILLLIAIYSYRSRRISNIHYLFYLIVVIYYVNSFFEEIAPFGPGMKTYFLWFLLAYLMNQEAPHGSKEII